jgi:hypothetical protein
VRTGSDNFSSRNKFATCERLELLHQRQITGRLFDRIQIGALHIFDDGEFERLRVGRFHHRDRHFVQTGALRRAPSPFAGNDFECFALAGRLGFRRAHHDRLDDAALLDRERQFGELELLEGAARVARIGMQILNRRPARLARGIGRRRFLRDLAHQRGQAASQSRVIRHRRRSRSCHACLLKFLVSLLLIPPLQGEGRSERSEDRGGVCFQSNEAPPGSLRSPPSPFRGGITPPLIPSRAG